MYLDRTKSESDTEFVPDRQTITLRVCNREVSEESSIVHDRNRTGGL
nr:MAG TPA: hypothetical protein [Caudoviricetes sp.]